MNKTQLIKEWIEKAEQGKKSVMVCKTKEKQEYWERFINELGLSNWVTTRIHVTTKQMKSMNSIWLEESNEQSL